MSGARRMKTGALLAALAAALTGCTLLSPVHFETEREMLTKVPTDLPREKTHAAKILVLPPVTQPAYDTVQIAYTSKPYRLAYFSRHQWAETPSQMLQPLLVRSLENTHYFSAVLVPPYAGHYDYTLQTGISQLIQDSTSDPAVVRLSLRVQLSDCMGRRLVAIRDVTEREPLRQNIEDAGAVASNDAAAGALREIARFVLDGAQRATARGPCPEASFSGSHP